MGIKSNRKVESYYNYFAASGYDAAPIPPPVVAWGDRGLYGGGSLGSNYNIIDYISIPSTGNATDFGDLTSARNGAAGVSNVSRGVWMGGNTGSHSNIIDYVTIASTGNATDFGDLSDARASCNNGCSSDVRGLVQGGWNGGNITNIEYITIATTGNGTEFGDLTQARHNSGVRPHPTYATF